MRNFVRFITTSLSFLLVAFSISSTDDFTVTEIQTIDLTKFIDANSILMFIDNQGGFGQDIDGLFNSPGDYGTYYPFLSVDSITNGSMVKSPLYAAGLWLGGKVNSQVKVALSDFSSEFWPGPMTGSSFDSLADTVQAYRVYKIYSDSAASNPNTDYLEWPEGQGAPTDLSGNPVLFGEQTLWSVFNDANSARHTNVAGSSSPLGIEVRASVWASDSAGEKRAIFFDYRLFNKSDSDITDFYCSIWLDPDLGAANDDLTGCDSLTEIFFCYNSSDSDFVYGTAPPAIGVKMLAGPVVPSVGDSAYFFGRVVNNYRNLPMSSFVSYPNGDDPQSATESYNVMQGLKRNGAPLDNGTRFSYPGDPVSGTGDVATVAGNPHFLGSFGPLSFPAGDSQYVFFKLGIGQGSDRLSSVTDLMTVLSSNNDFPTDIIIEDNRELPDNFDLKQNYPNPFNPSTTIEYELSIRGKVEIEIFNLLGQKVRTLVNETKSAGSYSISWNGRDDTGNELVSGIYFYRFRSGEFVQSKKMLLMK